MKQLRFSETMKAHYQSCFNRFFLIRDGRLRLNRVALDLFHSSVHERCLWLDHRMDHQSSWSSRLDRLRKALKIFPYKCHLQALIDGQKNNSDKKPYVQKLIVCLF